MTVAVPGYRTVAVAIRRAAGRGQRRVRMEHRWSRGTEGAHSGRISRVRNVETPSWSGAAGAGRPIARGAEYQAGQDGREANAGGRKATGNQASMPSPSRAGPA